MLPFLLLGAFFSMPVNFDFSSLAMLGGAIVVVVLLLKMVGPAKTVSLLTTLGPKAADFLLHLDRLGLPFLAPLLQAVAAGDLKDVPKAVHDIFDSFTKTDTRRAILFTLLKALLREQLSDPNKQAPVLTEIRNLGFVVDQVKTPE